MKHIIPPHSYVASHVFIPQRCYQCKYRYTGIGFTVADFGSTIANIAS